MEVFFNNFHIKAFHFYNIIRTFAELLTQYNLTNFSQMKKLSFAALSLLALACGRNTSDRAMSPAIPADNDLEKRVSEIVSKMSLDDKV